MTHRIRRVASANELREAFDVIGRQFDPPITHADRRFEDLARRFDEDRPLMLVVENDGHLIGGALAFRGEGGASLRIIGLEASQRGSGLGRRLVQTIEVEAMTLGVRSISLGAGREVKGFYTRLGYRGGGSSMHKDLPLPGRVLEYRLRKLRAAAGDLEAGEPLEVDIVSGSVPPLM